MRIGVIGSGLIGGTLARLLTRAGHEVMVSNSRGPETLAGLVGELGARATAGTPARAAAFGELVIVAVPFGRYRELPAAELAGRIVVDTNNYYPARDGELDELDEGVSTSSELLAAHLEGARVVKAFNTVWYRRLRDEGRPRGAPGRLAVALAGDDPDAKRTVAALVDEIGFDPVDTGGLAEGGRRQQPGSPIYDVALTADQLRQRLDA
ncbi:MAG TPA: NADPH-dependent F420 reductase [Actinomycetes bacterium]|nr:NADPH-dependent F420 reductase [Actinomycetes bacterium]